MQTGYSVASTERRPVSTPRDITQLLIAWSGGDQEAMGELVNVLDKELHRLAARHLAAERRGHVLQTTALVNEAYIKLIDWKTMQWQNRAQFLAMASRIMRHILVDYARAQHRQRRGGSAIRVGLSEAKNIPHQDSADFAALDEALQALESLAPRQGRIVELRFFGGLSLEETAEVLQVSVGTVRRDWSLARAWLYRKLSREKQ